MSLVDAVDLAIGLTLAEALGFGLWRAWRGQHEAALAMAPTLLSGLCLMAALRCALSQAPGPVMLLWLMAAGLAHAVDVWRRWPRPG